VLPHLNYGAELLAFLAPRGDTVARLRPWVEALRALQSGDRHALQSIAPDIRTTAEVFYDGLVRLLKKLPEKPAAARWRSWRHLVGGETAGHAVRFSVSNMEASSFRLMSRSCLRRAAAH